MSKRLLPINKAVKKLKNNDRIQSLLVKANKKAQENRDQLKDVWSDFQVFLRMLRSWVTREYTGVPWPTLIKLVAAIIYFVNPFDLIPDFIPALGFVDDISVIAYVIGSVKKDVDTFKEWENQNLRSS